MGGPPTTPDRLTSGRCHWCGYELTGLAPVGGCPECGTRYDQATIHRLRPWPSALAICVRLGWPVAGLAAACAIGADEPVAGMILGWPMIVALTINSYFQVRSMLRRSLPDRIRTRGPVAILRAIGTVLCVLLLLVFVGAPLIVGVGCMILLAGHA